MEILICFQYKKTAEQFKVELTEIDEKIKNKEIALTEKQIKKLLKRYDSYDYDIKKFPLPSGLFNLIKNRKLARRKTILHYRRYKYNSNSPEIKKKQLII